MKLLPVGSEIESRSHLKKMTLSGVQCVIPPSLGVEANVIFKMVLCSKPETTALRGNGYVYTNLHLVEERL